MNGLHVHTYLGPRGGQECAGVLDVAGQPKSTVVLVTRELGCPFLTWPTPRGGQLVSLGVAAPVMVGRIQTCVCC